MSRSRLMVVRVLGHTIGVLEGHVVASYVAMSIGLLACMVFAREGLVMLAVLAIGAPITIPYLAWSAINSDDAVVVGVVMIVAYALMLPVTIHRRWSRWHHRPIRMSGRCVKCSYNLTGNVSGVCPECGTPITA